MRKLHFSLKYCLIALVSVTYINMESIPTGYEGFLTRRQFFANEKRFQTPMHKVHMTQRGYIQFLRWGISVPEIREFTFCLWMHSTNMTYAQSFFSYSKNETERHIRSWVSPGGQTIFLEINNVEIFALPFSMEENRWYHLCQSWQSKDGHYGMWIDGTLKAEGYTREMIGYVIPSKGDIVVGQEFTDFDKGLEEGIEGSVLGFNFLLSSAFHSPETTSSVTSASGMNIFPISQGFIRSNAQGLIKHQGLINDQGLNNAQKLIKDQGLINQGLINQGLINDQGLSNPNSAGQINNPLYNGLVSGVDFNNINRSFRKRWINQKNPFALYKTGEQSRRIVFKEGEEKNMNFENGRRMFRVPLGLQLIVISHSHCEIGRGSPFIGGHLMLISWTRTPVRVFGGAVVKPVKSVCGYFY